MSSRKSDGDLTAHALLQKATLRPLVLGVAIDADLLMGNLRKTSEPSQVFSVFGKPDVTLSPPSADGYTVTMKGVDIYDPNTGDFDASSAEQIAAWFLDTDYDGATFLVRQACFPSQAPNPWERSAKRSRAAATPTNSPRSSAPARCRSRLASTSSAPSK